MSSPIFEAWPISRRDLLVGGTALIVTSAPIATPAASARDGQLAEAIAGFTKGARIAQGGMALSIAPLVENGNTVPVEITVDSPMTAEDHVTAIGLFNEKNPQPHVAIFHLGPRAGRARVVTRMRLATSQRVVAVAALKDGTFRGAEADVIVTLAACVEG